MNGRRRFQLRSLSLSQSVVLFLILIIGCIVSFLQLTTGKNINLKIKGMYSENPRKPRLLDYFNITDGIHVSWAHAVNNKTHLDEVLTDSNIMMLEADVLMNPVKNIPIMAHPPATSSDIDLEHWLSAVSHTNKGVKLDFKQDSAVTKSYGIIDRFYKKVQTSLKSNADVNQPITSMTDIHRPIILNADILLGPNSNSNTKPVNPELFINACKKFSNVIVSPGWVTKFKPNKAGYSWTNVKEMFSHVKDLEQYCTFPVRASLVHSSSEQLIWLLEQNVDQFSLTVWTSKDDKYDPKELLFLRKFKERVYFDLPDTEINELISLSTVNGGKKGTAD